MPRYTKTTLQHSDVNRWPILTEVGAGNTVSVIQQETCGDDVAAR
jgi:hypothetical protein